MKFAPASRKSAILIVLQFSTLIALFINTSLIPRNVYTASGVLLFGALGIWAMVTMKFNFNVAPEPLKNAGLVESGPYRLIRHPMYTSVIGIAASIVANDFSLYRLMIFLILLITLLLKLDYEEKILEKRFPEYKEYRKRTKRLIPFIF